MHLRPRLLPILVSLSLGAAGTAHAAGSALPPDEDGANPDTPLDAIRLASILANSPAIEDKLRILELLAKCDAEQNLMCRVDTGLAMAQLSMDERLPVFDRLNFRMRARMRLAGPAHYGNEQARQLLIALTEDERPGTAPRRTIHDAIERESAPVYAADLDLDTDPHHPPQTVALASVAPTEVIRIERAALAFNPMSHLRPVLPIEPHSMAVNIASSVVLAEPISTSRTASVELAAQTSMPARSSAAAPAPAADSAGQGQVVLASAVSRPAAPAAAPALLEDAAPSRSDLDAELARTLARLDATNAELKEANMTITRLREMLEVQKRAAFDPVATNREALQAALAGDYETAIPLFRKAAEANHTGALNNLAVLYVNGTGVPRDMQQALSLFERAAELHSMEAAENAARIYNYGIGRGKDPSRARAWYRKAIDMGSMRANQELAEMEQAISAGVHF